jgi:hypothetical protein
MTSQSSPAAKRASFIEGKSRSDRVDSKGRIQIKELPHLKLFLSYQSWSSGITIFPIIDISTSWSTRSTQSRRPLQLATKKSAVRQSTAGRRPGHGNQRLSTPKLQTNPRNIEDTMIQEGWADSSTMDIVRLSLDGDLAKAIHFDRHCRIVVPPGSVDQGLITLEMIRRMLVVQLGLTDPLAIELQVFPKRTFRANQPSIPKPQEGLQRYVLDDRIPLEQIWGTSERWIRVRLVEYLRLEIPNLGIATAITPSEKTTVGQLRRFTASLCQGNPRAITLRLNGTTLEVNAISLKSLQMKANSVVVVAYKGVECSSCMIVEPRGRYDAAVMSTCEHERTTCARCVNQWIRAQLDLTTWDRISCPECNQYLQQSDILKFAVKPVYSRWQNLANRSALNAIPEFHWCLSPAGCDYGHIHNPESGVNSFQCRKCAFRSCVLCDRPWHEDETCEQYSNRTAQNHADNEASAATILIISKSCPECKTPIEKRGGCDHMTCKLILFSCKEWLIIRAI